jgi:hypothetical protein
MLLPRLREVIVTCLPITRDVILLGDTNDETAAAKELLKSRHVKYAEVNGSLREPSPHYQRPTLLVRGIAFQGFEQIKKAINTNRHI